MLWTDVVTPAELTGYARAAVEDYEAKKGSLSRWLPNRMVPDIVARFFVGQAGLLPAAEYRGYDAETPLGGLPGGERITVELPPLGQKVRVSEYDQLRRRGKDAPDAVRNIIERAAGVNARAISDRLEVARGQALETGGLAIDENGFRQTGSWSRNPTHTVTVGTLWSDSANAKPLDDMAAWKELAIADTGEAPGAFVMSTKASVALARTAEMRSLAATLAGTPSRVTLDSVQGVLASHSLPPIYLYDRQIKVGATQKRVLTESKVFALPAPVDPDDWEGTDLGATFLGLTLESEEAEYGLSAEEQPGIVVGAWKTRDPIAVWTHSAAIGLPVLANSDLSIVASVLA
ncbi:major capsid protein [Nocardia colli]|uniref:major capsid protein n=1 Tax=Nocardia colli TaxID=2545717 RepID=UPI0035E184DB